MELVLSIDVGTTNLKVGVVNGSGELLILRKAPIPTHSSEQGAAEHDPQELLRLLTDLSRDVVSKFKNKIGYVALSTYHFGLMMVDQEMKPLTGMTILTDIRAQQTFSKFLEAYEPNSLYERTGCPSLGQYVLPRLFYFAQKKPELLKSASYFMGCKDFLIHSFTGEFLTEMSIATATQLFNISTCDWDDGLLASLGLSRSQFPKIVDGMKLLLPIRKDLARAIGLNENVRVVPSVYDGGALAVGLSGLAPQVGIMNVGTTAMFRVPHPQPALDRNVSKRLQAYALAPDIFLNGGALNNAALPLDWMRQKLFDIDMNDPSLLEITTNEPPLISLPYLTGERDSKMGPFASGVLFGLRRHHSRIDIARGLLEGVAYSMRYIYEALKENDIKLSELRMGGGGAAWRPWPQMFADTLGIPLLVPSVQEVALVGNAIITYTAAGEYESLKSACLAMVKSGERIEPNQERVDIHNERYEFFKKLRDTMSELYREHSKLS